MWSECGIVDAKLSSGSLKLSGTRLFRLLAAGVSAAALILDLIAGRLANIGLSLTLPLLVCALTAAVLGSRVVPLLQWLKTGQVIREDGPQAHLKKAGTPTMGGVFFVPVGALLGAVVCVGPDARYRICLCCLCSDSGLWLHRLA